MYYTIYKITNRINNKIYIGQHKTKNLHDEYFGSGTLIRRAFRKYGVENFTKEILFVFDTEEEMNKKEQELVEVNENTYNICPGGLGGFDYINRNNLSGYKLARISADRTIRAKYGVSNPSQIKSVRQKQSQNMTDQYKTGVRDRTSNMKGKKHSIHTIDLMKSDQRRSHKGSKNGMFGKTCMNDGKRNLVVSVNEISQRESMGYRRGRLPKNKPSS